NGIGVNAGDSKLMLLGINLQLRGKVNAARHKLTVKTVNGEVQLQALVDGKKIIVTEASVRRDLQLNDGEGRDCLPNATIYEELTRMGYEKLSRKLTFYKAFFSSQWKFLIHTILQCLSAKTTAWNEFSSTMDSIIICLATNQKFNFSKYIFESMVKNLDNAGKFLMYPRSRRTKRKDTEVPQPSGLTTNVADEAVNKEMDDNLVRDATTATGFEAEQDRGNIDKTQSKAIPNEPSSLGTSSGGGPRRQETMGDTIAQTSSENVSKLSNDSLLAGVNTPQSDEDRLKLQELMELCTNLQNRVINLENTKTAQAQEITRGCIQTGEKIDDIDKDAEITLVYETQERYGDEEVFDTAVLDGDEVLAKLEVTVKDVNLSVHEVTLS
ncbi:hypothetical protein Tco_1415427, partial [Tanacetum coccineum]